MQEPVPTPVSQPSPSPVSVKPLTQLQQELLTLNNDPETPYKVTVEDGKVIARWNIVDARWIEFFGKAGMRKQYELHLTFNEATHSVDYQDRMYGLEWKAGLPVMSAQASFFRGKTFEMSMGTGYGIKENGSLGQLYTFDFDTNRIKKPIFDVITKAGWTLKGLTFTPDLNLKKILPFLAIAAALIIVGIAVLIPRLAGSINAPALVVEQQLEALNNGSISEAYSLTASEFQSEVSLAQYRQVINSSGLTKTSNLNVNNRSVSNNTALVGGTLNTQIAGQTRERNFEAQLIKENDNWRVINIRIF